MKRNGKKYVEASKKVERNKAYTCEEAVELVKSTSMMLLLKLLSNLILMLKNLINN